jgi:hypothetical protein
MIFVSNPAAAMIVAAQTGCVIVLSEKSWTSERRHPSDSSKELSVRAQRPFWLHSVLTM